MVPVVDNWFFCYIHRKCISGMEHRNWTELALNDSEGVVASFGAKSKS